MGLIYGNLFLNENCMRIHKIDTSSTEKLKRQLINVAKNNKFTERNINGWSETYGTGEELEKRKKSISELLKSLDLGNCFYDDGGNYVVYSFKKDKFYFFDHESDGEENIKKGPWSLEKIKKFVEENK